MASKTTNRFSPEVRERAVRLVFEHVKDHPSRRATVTSIAAKIGSTAQSLNEWVKKGEIGPSGMGHYHGREGFETFSKLGPVFEEGWISAVQTFMQPPYTRFSRGILNLMVWMKS